MERFMFASQTAQNGQYICTTPHKQVEGNLGIVEIKEYESVDCRRLLLLSLTVSSTEGLTATCTAAFGLRILTYEMELQT